MTGDLLRTLVLPRLGAVRRAASVNGGYRARCPGHDDGPANLLAHAGRDRSVLLRCSHGCAPDRIAALLGIPWEKVGGPHARARRDLYRLDDVLAEPGFTYVCATAEDCDRIRDSTDLPACAARPGRTWTGQHARALAGFDVIVIAETGEDQRAYAVQVAQVLVSAARSVDVAAPTHGWTVGDHFAAGGTVESLALLARPKPPPEYSRLGLA